MIIIQIYGYYVEREGGKIEESVIVGQKNRNDPITFIKAFSSLDKVSFIVDMTGIVRSKILKVLNANVK